MLEAKAVGYNEVVSEASGASEPLIIEVQASVGDDIFPVYAKLTDKLLTGLNGYVIESISSLLANEMGLYTPEPCIVSIEDAFIDSVNDPAIQDRMRRSNRLAFATRKLPNGYSVVPKGINLSPIQIAKAADIFAFDMFIENPDRGGSGKPNCLMQGDSLAVIDHEKAFYAATGLLVLGRKEPWVIGAMEHYRTPDTHLFVNQLLENCGTIDLSGFQNRWAAITDARINEFGATIPPQWLSNGDCLARVLQQVAALRDNAAACITEINRVLS